MQRMIRSVALMCMIAAPAAAQQLMPPPHAAPRTPVNREALAGGHNSTTPHDVTGQALVIDGEKLRINESDMRLFGVVPPQLSANFGPQARSALDAVIGGQNVTCHIRDRDREGHLLATCQTAAGADPALELLKRGLAVAARGTIADTELAQPYVAAELAAQSAKLGLWSVAVAAPATPTPAPVAAPAPAPEAKAETPKPETPKSEAAKADAAKTDAAKTDSSTTKAAARTASAVMAPAAATDLVTPIAAEDNGRSPGFFVRFQLLIAGFLMLATALGVFGALTMHRRMERKEEVRALAAALRGELLAARAVCLTRAKSILTEKDDSLATWPRIRSTLYQAYVGKLGWLGAELARQIASIYGQASDYASYYNSAGETDGTATPKRAALQTLAEHIDAVLPRLAAIEQSGARFASSQAPVAAAPVTPMPIVPVVPSTALVPIAEAQARPVLPKPLVEQRRITQDVEETITETTTATVVEKPAATSTPSMSAAASSATASAAATTTTVPETPVVKEEKIEEKLFRAVRQLRERFVEPQPLATPSLLEEPMSDYTSLIEEDIERYSFSGDDDDLTPFSKLSRH